MNREYYYNEIEEQLSILAFRIKANNKLNLTSKNIHMENFLVHFYNLIFNLSIENANFLNMNNKAIDLVDSINRKIYQVSSTCTKIKLQESLNNIDPMYDGYEFYFSPIAKLDAKHLKKHSYISKTKIKFDINKNILDYTSILKKISTKKIEELIKIYQLVNLELGNILNVDFKCLSSSTNKIIMLLSKESLELNLEDTIFNTTEFEIQKKIDFNNLSKGIQKIIDEFKYYGNRINKKYEELEAMGNNTRFSVLHFFRKTYIKLSSNYDNEDELFLNITEEVMNKIISIDSDVQFDYEDLDLYVTILTVDAFIRCKIFENPNSMEVTIHDIAG